ncbi:dehydrase and lipid transport-domain-containing protein [Aspergillus spectabilis]
MNRLLPPRTLTGVSKPILRPQPSMCHHLRLQSNYTTLHQQCQPLTLKTTQHNTLRPQFPRDQIQKRTFLSSFFPQPNTNGNNNSSKTRTLTATRTLPYPPTSLFTVISSVDSYSSFLPFLTASTVTARDPETGYPTQAYLTVGYGPLSETFTSKVDCDKERWVVEARSGEKFVDSTSASGGPAKAGSESGFSGLSALAGVFPGADEGIFEFLSTRWELVPEEGGTEGTEPRTTVKLEIRFEFKNQMYAGMMSAVEGQMAGLMIEAFERRIREVSG